MRVFVSYTFKDPAVTKDKLLQVEAKIKPFTNVFIDLLHNENRDQCRVDRELRRCDRVLQLTSSIKSDWVQKEIVTARRKGKPVIKIGIDELLKMEPNIADDVVDALYAPTGAIVCPFHLTMAFAENAADNGVEFRFYL